jgi:hypothetical protein
MPDGRAKKLNPSFYYGARIMSFDFKVDAGGTNYNIRLVEYNTQAYHYLANVIRDQITIQAQTVGEFFEKFELALEESSERVWLLNESSAYKDNYIFEFDDETGTTSWERWRFQELDEDFKARGINIVGAANGDDALQITINNGSNLTELFGVILSLTKEYKQIVRSNGSGRVTNRYYKEDGPDQVLGLNDLSEFPVLHKVIATVAYGSYDLLRNDYQKTITYTCKAYIVTDEIVAPDSYHRSITNENVQRQRFRNIQNGGLLVKRYDYLNTGANTEILELDLNFNMAYYYIMPHGGGQFGDADTVGTQAVGAPEEAISRLKNAKANIGRQINQARNLTGQIKAGDTTVSFDQLAKSAQSQESRVTEARGQFDSALESTLIDIRAQFGLNEDEINHPVNIVTEVIDDSDIATSDNDRKGGLLRFGAFRSNVENPADLMTIEIGIRGDPYWMGTPNSRAARASRGSGDVETANYERGSINFFLKSNLPTPNEDGQGRRKPNPDYQVSGVYRVMNVINQFRNGQFIQYLKAVRDPASNTSTMWSTLDGESVSSPERTGASQQGRPVDPAQTTEDAFRNLISRLGGSL